MSYRDFKGVMRPGQNKRRGRNPNNPNSPNPNNNNPNNQNRQRGPQRMQTFDSSGPSVKIRGNAYQVFERYVALAREAALSGDRIAAENLYQHAEHYFRVMNANGDGQSQGAPRPTTPADTEMTGPEQDYDGEPQQDQPQQQYQPQHQQPSQHQPQQHQPQQHQPQQHQPQHHHQAQPQHDQQPHQQPEPPAADQSELPSDPFAN
jgi:hypothetical protein